MIDIDSERGRQILLYIEGLGKLEASMRKAISVFNSIDLTKAIESLKQAAQSQPR